MMTTRSLRLSVVKSFGPTVFMNFGPGRKRLQIASGASGVAESCGLGQAVAGAAETVRGTLRVAGNGAGDSRAQRLGSGEHAAGGLAFGVDRTWASPWRLWQGPLEPLRGNVVGSFLDTLTVLPPRGGTGRTVTPSGALRVDGDTLWGVSVSRSGEFHMSVIGTGWIGGSGARVFWVLAASLDDRVSCIGHDTAVAATDRTHPATPPIDAA